MPSCAAPWRLPRVLRSVVQLRASSQREVFSGIRPQRGSSSSSRNCSGAALRTSSSSIPAWTSGRRVFQQGVEGYAQVVGRLARRRLAQAAGQGTQLDQLLDPVLQQAPVAIEAILLGQALAAAEQVPGEGGEGIVQWGYSAFSSGGGRLRL